MNKIFLSLGSNSGCRKKNLERALKYLAEKIMVLKRSGIYETDLWGKFEIKQTSRKRTFKHRNPQRFLNIAVEGTTHLAPEELLKFTQRIEEKLGRRRAKNPPADFSRAYVCEESATCKEPTACEKSITKLQTRRKYHSRPIDIDILFYNNFRLKTPNLAIPHPQIPHRKFVLQPLAEIAPNHIHPIFKKTAQELLNECTDTSIVRPVL